jgi:hypothetical protein
VPVDKVENVREVGFSNEMLADHPLITYLLVHAGYRIGCLLSFDLFFRKLSSADVSIQARSTVAA